MPKKAHIVFFANALNNINFEKNDKINMSLFQNSVLNKYLKGLESEKVNEAYERFTTHFQNPTIQENIRNSKEEQYQGEFLIDLFVNVFGYVKNPTPDFNLTTELKNIKDSKKTDGAILKGKKALAVIELKGTNTTDLSKVETQAFGYKNNQPGCNYVITSNFEKLRFYIDNAVEFEEFNLFQLTKERFEILWLCLSSEYLLKDIPKKIKDESLTQEEKITEELYKDYASFRNEVFDTIQKENPQYDKLTLFKKTQKLLDRFLFIFFAEDRLLLPPNSIRSIVNQWTDLKDKYDEYFPLYDRFLKYFGYMNTGHKGQQHDIFAYNGGLFAPDKVLDNIKINDDLLYKHTVNLSNYDFESEVSVNILGHIFEHSLNDIDEIQAELQGIKTVQSKTKRKKDGVFYTPKYITKYIVDKTVGKLCEEKKIELDIQETEYEKERKGRQKATLKRLTQKLEDYRKWLLQITICDPACGSGAFLNQALDFLIAEHQYIDELQAKLFGDAMILSEVENAILENNIYGVDINDESVEIAKLSLWLRTAQKGRKLTSLNSNIKCGNSLIDDPNVDGEKAFNWQKEFPKVFSKGGFDIIIGNPPWGAKIPKSQKDFVNSNYWCNKGEIETYVHFTELGISRLCKENGILGFITPNTWYYLDKYAKLRDNLLNKRIVELIELEKRIFKDAPDIVPAVFILENSLKSKNQVIQTFKLDKGVIPTFLVDNTIFKNYQIESNDWLKFESTPFNLSLTNNVASLLVKIREGSVPLKTLYNVRYGIKTGNNKKYVSNNNLNDNWQYCLPSASTVKKFQLNWEGHYLNFGNHLAGYSKNSFERPKILVQYIRKLSMPIRIISALDGEGKYYPLNNFSFIEENSSNNESLDYLIGILNSSLMNFYFKNVHIDYNIKPKYLEKLPIKIGLKKEIIEFTTKIKSNYISFNSILTNLLDLLSNKFNILKFPMKLKNWDRLNFGEFLKELEKVRKIVAKENKIEFSNFSLSEEAEWMQYFNEQKVKALTLKTEIDKTTKEIDHKIYELYGLSEKEIELVENANA